MSTKTILINYGVALRRGLGQYLLNGKLGKRGAVKINRMIRVGAIVLFGGLTSQAAVIVDNDFTTSSNNTKAHDAVHANVTATSAQAIKNGSLAPQGDPNIRFATSGAQVFRSLNATSISASANDYHRFTVTADPGYSLTFSDISFDWQTTGPTTFGIQVAYNIDGGAFTLLGTKTTGSAVPTTPITVDLSSIPTTTDTVEFRFVYEDDNAGGSSYSRVRNMFLNGTVNDLSNVPEPSTLALAFLGLFMLGSGRRILQKRGND